MNWNHVANDWEKAGDRIKVTWGKLSESDIATVNGNRELLAAMLQEHYHFSEAKVEEMIDHFANRLRVVSKPTPDNEQACESDEYFEQV